MILRLWVIHVNTVPPPPSGSEWWVVEWMLNTGGR